MTSLLYTLLLVIATSDVSRSSATIDPATKQAIVTSLSALTAAVRRCDGDVLTNCSKYRDTPSCSCDWRTCRLYGDCCRSLPILRGNETMPPGQVNLKKLSVVSCLNLHRLHSAEFNQSWSRDVYVINRCPLRYSSATGNEDIAALCTMGNRTDIDDAFLRLPVYGRRSLIFYMNVYCAMCNNETDFAYLKVEKICSSKTSEEDLCESQIELPDNRYVKKCVPNLIDSCPTQYGDRKVARKCAADENTTFYMYQRVSSPRPGSIATEITYRNQHCALCNQVAESQSQLNCTSEYTGEKTKPPSEIPPFSVLLDVTAGFRTEQDAVVDGTVIEVNITVTQLQQCPTNHVFDPFNGHCRQLFCSPGSGRHLNSDLRCESVHATGSASSDPQVKNTNQIVRKRPYYIGDSATECSLLQLNESEFDRIDNGSIILRQPFTNGVVYWPGQFWVVDNGTFICSPFNETGFNVTFNSTRLVTMFKYDIVQSILSVVGSVISLIALAIQFSVYMLLPGLRNTPGKCIVCLSVSLFVGQLLYLFVGLHGDNDVLDNVKSVCFWQAVVMHYVFIASFCWMNVLAVDVSRTFTSTKVVATSANNSASTKTRSFTFYSLYAWGLPLAIVLCTVLVDVIPSNIKLLEIVRPLYGHRFCWIGSRIALILYFAAPIGALWTANVIMFTVSARQIYRASEAARPASQSTSSGPSALLVIYIKLSCIMGLTWGFGFIATFTNWTALWYLFIIFNTLQGAWICGSFTCTTRTFRSLKERFAINVSRTSDTTTTTTTTTTKHRYSTDTTTLQRI